MKIQYWFSIYYFLALSLSASAAIEPGNAKAFKIQYQGRTSFILGTWHDFDVQSNRFPSEILGALNQVDEVVLETDRFDDRGELLPEPEPDISKIIAFKPIRLGSRSKEVAQQLLGNSDLKNFYNRLSPGLIHFFAHYFADQIISNTFIKVGEAFASNDILKSRFGRIRLKPSHREAAKYLLGSSVSDDTLFMLAFDYFMKKRNLTVPRSGLVSEVYREARKRDLKISGLQHTEPYTNVVESTVAFVNESEVDRTLIWIGEMIDEKNAAQNWANIIHSRFLIHNLQSRFFYIDNHKFMELMDLVAAFPSLAPGEDRVKAYERTRHKFWVSDLIRRMKNSSIFIAVGVSHVIGSKDYKSLLDYLRAQGAVIEPIVVCQNFLRKRPDEN